MLTAKKKINVREAVPTSSIVDYWFTTRDFVLANAKIILGVAAGIIAIVVLAYVYLGGMAADENESSRELRLLQPLIQQNQHKLAINGDPTRGLKGLKDIVDQYGGTQSGSFAALYLGNAYLYTGEYDKALAAYDEVSGNDMLNANALAGSAAVYEAKKDYNKAAELYEKAAVMYKNDLLSASRYFNAARAYCMAGSKDRASELFAKVKEAQTPRFEQSITRLKAQYGIPD